MNGDEENFPDRAADSSAESEPTPMVVRTEDLFHGTREICIEHEGERYRLRITRRGKLILQK